MSRLLFCGVSYLVCCNLMLCVCYKLAACTGDAAQSLLSRHGVAGCLRREVREAGAQIDSGCKVREAGAWIDSG